MAVLQKIFIRSFRNIASQEISFSRNVNCITGGNGEGKTNLLDAIYYLSMTKSAFAASDRFNFRHGDNSFSLCGIYSMPNGTESRISVQVESGASKILKRDDKQYSRFSEHIGLLPVVMISPADISLVSESGEERRRFVNSVLSQMDREYLEDLQNYSRLLLQRNSLLRSGNGDDVLFESIDSMMDAVASRIFARRSEFVRDLNPVIVKWYSRLSGGKEDVGLEYRSDLQKGALKVLLASSREKDRHLGFTSEGIQKDDFLFSMDGYPIRKCGSQGQQKSFVVSLKLAQYELMKFCTSMEPILLMDDLFDKLDMGRVRNLLEIVSGDEFGQIFLSDSNKVRMESIVESINGDHLCLQAESGTFSICDGR